MGFTTNNPEGYQDVSLKNVCVELNWGNKRWLLMHGERYIQVNFTENI